MEKSLTFGNLSGICGISGWISQGCLQEIWIHSAELREVASPSVTDATKTPPTSTSIMADQMDDALREVWFSFVVCVTVQLMIGSV